MTGRSPRETLAWRAAVAGVVLAIALATVPDPASRLGVILYLVPVLLSAALMSIAQTRISGPLRAHWRWLMLGTWVFVIGEIWSAYLELVGSEIWPTPADAFYIVGLLIVVATVLQMNLRRAGGTYLGDVLDSAIVATSTGVLLVVFFVLPVTQDSSLGPLGRVVGSAYPIVDVLLVYLVARMMITPAGRSSGHWFLMAAQASTLAADLGWNLTQLASDGEGLYPRWMNLLWLGWYLFMLVAAVQAGRPEEPHVAARRGGVLTPLRLIVLTVASLLPVIILMSLNAMHRLTHVGWLGTGAIMLGVLVTARMWDLLQQLSTQTAQVADLARLDPLTGLPNRRTWDAALSDACDRPDGDTGLVVALLDLDHFKTYNDSFGHQAGDDLLRETAEVWSRILAGNGIVARWGGEEFTVLLPGHGADDAVAVLERLRAGVPRGQTCSVGAAVRLGRETAAALLQRADRALYEAKNGGRDQLVLADRPDSPSVPGPRLDPASQQTPLAR